MMRRVEKLVDMTTTIAKLVGGFGIAGYLAWCSLTRNGPSEAIALMLCVTAVMVVATTVMIVSKPQSA